MLGCALRRKDLHNPPLRVTMRQTETQKRFPSWAGETSPVLGREAFLTTEMTTDSSGTPVKRSSKEV